MKTKVKALPQILNFTEIKYYIFTSVFTFTAILVPWLLHRFSLAGPQFVPMHYFILIAGFLFGWRVGLVTAVSSSLMSYSISHMPPLMILPEVTLELAIYGVVIGILREKNLRLWPSLIGAMVAGRLSRLLLVLTLGLKTNPINYFQMSLIGTALQLILIPLIIYGAQKLLFTKEI